MINTSTLYNTILSGPHSKEVKLNIAGADYGMDALTSLRTSLVPFGSGSPAIGLAPAAEITASLYLASSSVPRMAALRPYVRLVSEGGAVSEWLPQGVFYVDTRQQDESGLLTLHGYDGMLKAERPAPYSTLQWPAPDTDVVGEICSILGFTVDARTTALMTSGFRISLQISLSGLTQRSFCAGRLNTLQPVGTGNINALCICQCRITSICMNMRKADVTVRI